MLLPDLLVSEDHWNCTAICYDDGESKVYVTYSNLLQSSMELTSGLRRQVGSNEVYIIYGCALCRRQGWFLLAHVTRCLRYELSSFVDFTLLKRSLQRDAFFHEY